MQRRDRGLSHTREHGEMHEVRMEMQDVESCGETLYLFQHCQVIGDMLANPRIEPKGSLTTCHQPSGRLGIAARKKSDVMPLPHQFLGEVGDDAFGAAIEARGHAFDEGSDLSYFHGPYWRSTLPKTARATLWFRPWREPAIPTTLRWKDALVAARWMPRDRARPAGRCSEMTLPEPTSAKPTMMRGLPKDVADPAKPIR